MKQAQSDLLQDRTVNAYSRDLNTKSRHYRQRVLMLVAIIALISLGLFFYENNNSGNNSATKLNDSLAGKNTAAAALTPSSNLPTITSNSAANPANASGSNATNNDTVSVNINGQPVENIPQNGDYSKTINTSSGHTNINIDNNYSSSSNGSSAVNNSTTTVNVDSTSNSGGGM